VHPAVLERGEVPFRDVTEQAGLHSKGWTTGVTLADVNGDGRLDIYVCHAGLGDGGLRANELYINQGLNADGVPTFVEQAAAYGVADSGYSTQAVFFDYDRDGDLDLFVINNSPRPVASMPVKNTRNERDLLGGAKLYRNDGGHFTDVSAARYLRRRDRPGPGRRRERREPRRLARYLRGQRLLRARLSLHQQG